MTVSLAVPTTVVPLTVTSSEPTTVPLVETTAVPYIHPLGDTKYAFSRIPGDSPGIRRF